MSGQAEIVQAALKQVHAKQNLDQPAMQAVIGAMMRGDVPEAQMGEFLLALKAKGETIDEVAGAAMAMRATMTPIRSARSGLLDTCGTGGDGGGTFNISTAAAIVTAAAGVPVAKHGNRSITSRTGSADVLAELGVNISASLEVVQRCLDELGICFCFAPQLHPAMKHVSAVRKSLGVPTIFNLLGPLCNPASASFQVLGVGKRPAHPLLAGALARLPITRAFVVCGEDGMDEVTLSGETYVIEVTPGKQTSAVWTPKMFGLARQGKEEMLVDGPPQSAALISRILAGEKGAPRDVVLLNAAAGLFVAGKVDSLAAGAERAAEAIDSGAAKQLLQRLAKLSQG